MADLGTHFYIGDTLTIPFQARAASGAEVDADALPTYQVYEEGGTTALAGLPAAAKRDDANTTGYYEAVVTLSNANGFEVGKSYTIRKRAVIGGVAATVVDTFAITGAGSFAASAITGYPSVTDVEARLTDMGITHPADATTQALINAAIRTWENKTGYHPFLNASSTLSTKYFPICNGLIDFTGPGGFFTNPTVLNVGGYWDGDAVYTGGSDIVRMRDIVLKPDNALDLGRPYTYAILTGYRYWGSDDRTPYVKVTAAFGWGATLPDDVWEAIVEEAAERIRRLATGTGELKAIKQGPVTWEYATSSNQVMSAVMGVTLPGYRREGVA
jgi:hypothetical protein